MSGVSSSPRERDECADTLRGGFREDAVDPRDEREPLEPETRTQIEAFVSTSKLALYRSEDAKVLEEANRTISESVVNEGDDDTGRIRDALS